MECFGQVDTYCERCCVQVCGEGYVLDLQLLAGSPHVALLSLLLLMVNLKEQAATLLTPADNGSAKVLLRLPVQVRNSNTRRADLCRTLTAAQHDRNSMLARHVSMSTACSSHQPCSSLSCPLLCRFLALQSQDDASLGHVVSSQLRSLSSPFVSIEPVPPTALAAAAGAAPGTPQAPGEELHFVAEATAVSEWLSGPAVGLVLGQLCKQGMDGLLACQEDAQREMKCRQAMVSVQTFEANAAINPQVSRSCDHC